MGLLFGGEAGGALGGATLHEFIVEDQLGLGDPGEGQKKGLFLVLDIDADVVAVDAGQLALEALAVLGEAVEFDAGLQALEDLEVLEPVQRPVDAGRRCSS